ncbi:endoribonuclease L-PSP [Thraustotheca clavata]|uniref:Endoribonuclease L-PSP n=1 Tax=Thraustotheca clavata TaxID=74557 RepID=A0A1W0A5Y6_9STRA|nr:endoribonuclease L-PSP [Thraustotheca clavata]
MSIDERLAELGYVLPAVGTAKGNYKLAVRSGNLIFTAGHIAANTNGELYAGKVGKDFTTQEAYDIAHHVALSILATLKQELGDLNKIKRIVKIVGFVNCTDDFTAQPSVINGASDTFAKVLGEHGIGARSAVGTNALPLNAPVEIEAVVEIEE